MIRDLRKRPRTAARYLGALVAVLSGSAAIAGPTAPIVVATRTGVVRGVAAADTIAFKGVPFAAPPVGALRWRPPRPARGWSGVRDASTPGPACPQVVPPDQPAPAALSEDCLYLNIWKPAAASRTKLPVIVWINGGAFALGDSGSPADDGAHLARRGVIVLDFNYRLGRLGWFATSGLTREASGAGTGNFGLMDQVAVLRWVRANIAAFGGDPAGVTIAGQSAGGMSVNLLMVSPAARGLFARAITESGFGRIPARPLAKAEAVGDAFARKIGAPDLAALRRVPVSVLLGSPPASLESDENPEPILDGVVVPHDVTEAFSRRLEARVPWLVGSNTADASLFPGMLADPQQLFRRIPAVLRPIYLYAFGAGDGRNPRDVASDLVTDTVFTEPARYLAMLHARNGAPTYRYAFGYVPQARGNSSTGTPHAGEVQFVFGNLPATASVADRRMSALVGGYWTNFAYRGDPNGSGLTSWPQDGEDSILKIDTVGERALVGYRRSELNMVGRAWLPWVGVAALAIIIAGVAFGVRFVRRRRRLSRDQSTI